MTGFARVGDELWATSQGYGEGREPEVRWKRGEVRLLPVLVKVSWRWERGRGEREGRC